MGCLDLRLQAGIYNMTTGVRLHISHSRNACKKLCQHWAETQQSGCCTYLAVAFMI